MFDVESVEVWEVLEKKNEEESRKTRVVGTGAPRLQSASGHVCPLGSRALCLLERLMTASVRQALALRAS